MAAALLSSMPDCADSAEKVCRARHAGLPQMQLTRKNRPLTASLLVRKGSVRYHLPIRVRRKMEMNILVINGSPKGDKSNSYQLTKAFLEGIKQEEIGRASCRERV